MFEDLKLECNSILCGSVISSCENSFNWPMALHLLHWKERSPEMGGNWDGSGRRNQIKPTIMVI